MEKTTFQVLDEVILKHGMEIDLEEGWRKLISRQFGGDASKAFRELIQNYIDSYDPDIPLERRRGEIHTGNNWISLTDFGTGLDRKKLNLITTIGGTDKFENDSKIGNFGIGFVSIFNPRLGTSKVILTTACEGTPVELTYHVIDPEKRPRLDIRVLKDALPYSTRVLVCFDNSISVHNCLKWAHKSLNYYPCPVTINGEKFVSVWEKARNQALFMFREQYCNGFIAGQGSYSEVSLLCKYELVKKVSLPALLKGGYDMKFDLRDYDGDNTPYIPYVNLVLNCDDLRLTISRDSYYLDHVWSSMKTNLSSALLAYLNEYLEHSQSDSIVIANHYILRNKLRSLLQNYESTDFDRSHQNQALDKLLKAKVYPLRNKREKYSLLDIKDKLSEDLPVFFSPDKLNTRWLGGNFRHDFVILPPKIAHYISAPDLYQRIFEVLFGEAINLDTVTDYQHILDNLINRNIIEKSSLAPECKIIGPRHLNKRETAFLNSVNALLQDKGVRMAIEDNLHLPIRNLKAIFFDLKKEGVQVSTGLFDPEGNPIDKDFISNIMEVKDKKQKERLLQKNTLLLGLRMDHPFVQYLLNCDNQHIAYYTLTYLASELTLCQKILVPYSPMHHFVKHKLVQAMRKALIARLATETRR